MLITTKLICAFVFAYAKSRFHKVHVMINEKIPMPYQMCFSEVLVQIILFLVKVAD